MTARPGRRFRLGEARIASACAAALVSAGILLRAVQYATNRSLWLDEGSLALNIVGRPWSALFGLLSNRQVAPVGFLLVEKATWTVLGPAAWALRLYPFVAGCAALPLAWMVARRAVGPVAGLVATAIVAVSPAAVYYSSEIKQYSSDVAVSLALLLVAARVREFPGPHRRWLELGLAGMIAPWLSQPATFVLAGIGAALGIESLALRDGAKTGKLALVAIAWLASFALLYRVSLSAVLGAEELRDFMGRFWQRRDCFAPTSLSAWPGWLGRTGIAVMNWPVGLSSLGWLPRWPDGALLGLPPWLLRARLDLVGAVLAILGCGRLALRRPWWAAALGLPLALVVVLSAPRVYPCCDRLVLFAVPMLSMFVGAALGWPLEKWRGRPFGVALAAGVGGLVCMALAPSAYLQFRYPVVRENLRPVLEELARVRRPGEGLAVCYWDANVVRFHAPLGLLDLRGARWIGEWGSREGSERAIRASIRALSSGTRVWIVCTHPDYKREEYRLAAAELDHVGHVVRRIDDIDASALLYEFGDGGGASPAR